MLYYRKIRISNYDVTNRNFPSNLRILTISASLRMFFLPSHFIPLRSSSRFPFDFFTARDWLEATLDQNFFNAILHTSICSLQNEEATAGFINLLRIILPLKITTKFFNFISQLDRFILHLALQLMLPTTVKKREVPIIHLNGIPCFHLIHP